MFTIITVLRRRIPPYRCMRLKALCTRSTENNSIMYIQAGRRGWGGLVGRAGVIAQISVTRYLHYVALFRAMCARIHALGYIHIYTRASTHTRAHTHTHPIPPPPPPYTHRHTHLYTTNPHTRYKSRCQELYSSREERVSKLSTALAKCASHHSTEPLSQQTYLVVRKRSKPPTFHPWKTTLGGPRLKLLTRERELIRDLR